MDKAELVAKVTRAVREADREFEDTGGSSRHWVRDNFLPALERHGLKIEEQESAAVRVPSGRSWSWGDVPKWMQDALGIEPHEWDNMTTTEQMAFLLGSWGRSAGDVLRAAREVERTMRPKGTGGSIALRELFEAVRKERGDG